LIGPLAEAELRDWFGAASIYVLPALYEPFGYTPLEAGLSACALVLGDIESLREIWDDAAIYVDPHNSDSLKTELLRLIQNEPYRREMSRRARERALLYSSELMAKKYLRAYSDLLVQLQPRHRQEKLAQCA
jgi:glycosyltransferase involved in cell wall biosynthesis